LAGSDQADDSDASNMNNHVKIFVSALSLAVPLAAAAQFTRSEPGATSPPAPASASPSALSYQSAFADYKPYQDIKRGDWKASNDTVGNAAGGHSGHGMDRSPPQPAAANPTGHAGHEMGGVKK
jgi:hypothetical protein